MIRIVKIQREIYRIKAIGNFVEIYIRNLGCYYPVETSNGYVIAENRCKAFNNGYLATVENEDKMRFLWKSSEI